MIKKKKDLLVALRERARGQMFLLCMSLAACSQIEYITSQCSHKMIHLLTFVIDRFSLVFITFCKNSVSLARFSLQNFLCHLLTLVCQSRLKASLWTVLCRNLCISANRLFSWVRQN